MVQINELVECRTCGHESDFNKANVKGDGVFCISCGEPIEEVERVTQARVDVLRCRPFAEGLASFKIGG